MPFTKGQGGRPRGARNRTTTSKDIRELLEQVKSGDGDVERLRTLSRSADEQVALKATLAILAYRFGKPPERLEVGGEGGGPVQVTFVGLDGKVL